MPKIERPSSEDYKKSSVKTDVIKINDNGEVTVGSDCGCPHMKKNNEMDSPFS